MDEDPGWRLLRGGELVHVRPGPHVETSLALDEPPEHPLTLADLAPDAAASQRPGGAPGTTRR
jgi:glutamine amidotransferase